MENSKSKIIFLVFILAVLVNCQTNQVFDMRSDAKNELNVVVIDSDRVIQECYFMNAEKENKWRHSYLLHMLNERGEVITASYPINLDKEACHDHLKKVNKILKKENKVKLCIRDNLTTDRRKDPIEEVIDFGPLGKHSSPYDFLTFDTICNSKDCVSISDTWKNTCPEFTK